MVTMPPFGLALSPEGIGFCVILQAESPMKSILTVSLSVALWGCIQDHGDSAQQFEPSCTEDPELLIEWDGSRLHLEAEGCGSVTLTPRVIGSGEWSVEMEPSAEGGWQPRVSASGPGQFEGLVLEGEWQLSGV